MNEVLLGDCYQLIKDIPDNSIDLVYTDIPYLIIDGGHQEKKGEMAKRIRNEGVNIAHLANGIDYSIFDEMCRVLKYIYIYIWVSKEQMYDVMSYFADKNCNMNILVWCKTNPTPATNGNWLPDVEYCLVFKENDSPKYNDGYRIKSKWFVSAANKYDKDQFLHPTIKPIEFVKRHILHSTQKGDVVLDPFCGSGTTLKACQELERNYIGMEIDPVYHKIAVDRLNNINARGEISLF